MARELLVLELEPGLGGNPWDGVRDLQKPFEETPRETSAGVRRGVRGGVRPGRSLRKAVSACENARHSSDADGAKALGNLSSASPWVPWAWARHPKPG